MKRKRRHIISFLNHYPTSLRLRMVLMVFKNVTLSTSCSCLDVTSLMFFRRYVYQRSCIYNVGKRTSRACHNIVSSFPRRRNDSNGVDESAILTVEADITCCGTLA